jgi:hypothetical protein
MREVMILAQAQHAEIAGRQIAYPACLEDVEFFREGLRGPRARSIQIGIPAPSWPPTSCVEVAAFMAHRLAHVADQPNWFRLSEGLAERLMTTELRGLTPTDIRLPFHTLAIEVPQGLLELSDPETGFHCVRCILVADCDGSMSQHPRALKGRHLMLFVQCEANEHSPTSFETLDLHFTLSLKDSNQTLHEQDIERAAQYGATIERKGRLFGRETDPLEARQLIVQLVLNVLLYLSSDRADVCHCHANEIARLTKGRDRKKLRAVLRERIGRLERERVFIVGSSVRIDPALREHLSRSPGSGSSLAYRTVVRGHWKHQPFGEARAERRLIWIQPYVRGGDDLPQKLIGHTYKVA